MASPHLSQEALAPMAQETHEDFGEKCGVFGIYEPGTNVAEATYQGLVMLKHRGQDASGQVVVTEDGELHLYKQLGNVKEVFDNGQALPKVLPVIGRLAIGHNRYGTMASVAVQERWNAAQPIVGSNGNEGNFAIGYNGDVSNIQDVMRRHGYADGSYVSDTDGVVKLLELYMSGDVPNDLPAALRQVLPQLEGAFSGVFTDGQRLIGARDPNGFRPFVYGTTVTGGHVLASEIRALREVGATFQCEISTGEMIIIDETGVQFERFADDHSTPCAYELFYFSKEDNVFHGQKVGDVRWRFGEQLALEHPVQTDLVVGVPNSGVTAAQAYAKALNLSYVQVIEKNKKDGDLRSFLANSQNEREAIAKAKFIIDQIEVSGMSVTMVDDSVIRGTVSKIMIQMLRDAGATSVHVRVPAPMYKYPCYYGMDTGRVDELLATNRTQEEMREFIGADSLEFLSPDGVVRAVQRPVGKLCLACSTGDYPTDVSVKLIK